MAIGLLVGLGSVVGRFVTTETVTGIQIRDFSEVYLGGLEHLCGA